MGGHTAHGLLDGCDDSCAGNCTPAASWVQSAGWARTVTREGARRTAVSGASGRERVTPTRTIVSGQLWAGTVPGRGSCTAARGQTVAFTSNSPDVRSV